MIEVHLRRFIYNKYAKKYIDELFAIHYNNKNFIKTFAGCLRSIAKNSKEKKYHLAFINSENYSLMLDLTFCNNNIDNDIIKQIINKKYFVLNKRLAQSQRLSKDNFYLLLKTDPSVAIYDSRFVNSITEFFSLKENFDKLVLINNYETI